MSAAPHDHDATVDFDPTCPRCREGWQAAYDQAQCDYLEAQFVVGQTPPSDGDQMT
jgi:protein-disulfide isomerase